MTAAINLVTILHLYCAIRLQLFPNAKTTCLFRSGLLILWVLAWMSIAAVDGRVADLGLLRHDSLSIWKE